MCKQLTPVLNVITTVIIEVDLQSVTESASQRELGKPTSRAKKVATTLYTLRLYINTKLGLHCCHGTQ